MLWNVGDKSVLYFFIQFLFQIIAMCVLIRNRPYGQIHIHVRQFRYTITTVKSNLFVSSNYCDKIQSTSWWSWWNQRFQLKLMNAHDPSLLFTSFDGRDEAKRNWHWVQIASGIIQCGIWVAADSSPPYLWPVAWKYLTFKWPLKFFPVHLNKHWPVAIGWQRT